MSSCSKTLEPIPQNKGIGITWFHFHMSRLSTSLVIPDSLLDKTRLKLAIIVTDCNPQVLERSVTIMHKRFATAVILLCEIDHSIHSLMNSLTGRAFLKEWQGAATAVKRCWISCQAFQNDFFLNSTSKENLFHSLYASSSCL